MNLLMLKSIVAQHIPLQELTWQRPCPNYPLTAQWLPTVCGYVGVCENKWFQLLFWSTYNPGAIWLQPEHFTLLSVCPQKRLPVTLVAPILHFRWHLSCYVWARATGRQRLLVNVYSKYWLLEAKERPGDKVCKHQGSVLPVQMEAQFIRIVFWTWKSKCHLKKKQHFTKKLNVAISIWANKYVSFVLFFFIIICIYWTFMTFQVHPQRKYGTASVKRPQKKKNLLC